MQHIVRNTLENYLQMSNHSAQNDNLSLQAKGLLMVLMSNQDTWRPYIDELSKRSKNGRDAHRTAYEELKQAGYIRIYKKSLGRGRGILREPLVMDKPISDSYFERWKSQIDKELSTTSEENTDF